MSNEVCRAAKCAKGKYEHVHSIKVQPSALVDISKKVTEVYVSLQHSSVSVVNKLQVGLPRNRAEISRAAGRGSGLGIKKIRAPSKGGPAKNLYTQWGRLSFAEWLGLGLRGLICTIDK